MQLHVLTNQTKRSFKIFNFNQTLSPTLLISRAVFVFIFFAFGAGYSIVVFGDDSSVEELSRSEAERKFVDKGWDYVQIKVSGVSTTDSGKVLLENGLGVKRKKYWPDGYEIGPTPLLAISIIDTDYGVAARATYYVLSYGKILDAEVTGITKSGVNERIVEFSLRLERSFISTIFGNRRDIQFVASYRLYDDGWRFRDVLWKETNNLSDWNKNTLHGFTSKLEFYNSSLRKMHELGIYGVLYKYYQQDLESTNVPRYINSAAWAYKDFGEKEKALSLYKNKLLPIVEGRGDLTLLRKYQQIYKKIQE